VDRVKAILFDLHGTIGFVKNPVSDLEISEYLSSRGYDVSPQQLRAAWFYVSMVDYPIYGYRSWRSYFSKILYRLKIKVDKETLNDIVRLLESRPYQLYPDAAGAVVKAKKYGFKTAIVTTIAYFQFKRAIQPIREYLDFIMTGYEARCDKSNVQMYRKLLEILEVKPCEAVMIGDNVLIDIILPKKLGINAILLDREKKEIECSQADAIVNNLNAALEIIVGQSSKKSGKDFEC